MLTDDSVDIPGLLSVGSLANRHHLNVHFVVFRRPAGISAVSLLMVSAGVSVATVAENSTGLCGRSCGGNGGRGHDPLHRRADSVIDDRRRDVGFISRKGAGGGNGGDSEQGKQSFFIRDSSISKSQKSRGAGRRNNPGGANPLNLLFLANVEVR